MARRQRDVLLRTFAFLFALNSLSLAIYFLLQSRPHQNPAVKTLDEKKPVASREALPAGQPPPSRLKPWPSLPSFLPWRFSPASAARSCEAYFGHGFSRHVPVLGGAEGGGWFRCLYSETLQSSICEAGGLLMDPGLIAMSPGGERLDDVMGRDELDELPKFQAGAFLIEAGTEDPAQRERLVNDTFLDEFVPRGNVNIHTMRFLLDSVRIVRPGMLNCSQWVEEPTLLVTRFEYANLFHTITDWYSAYVTSRVTDLPNRPHVVFVDGHCETQLEQGWQALFSSIRYAKNFSGPVCFRHAVLSPLGYETALFKGLTDRFSCQGARAHVLREHPDDRRTARLHEFGEMFMSSFGLLPENGNFSKSSLRPNVLFVRREDYLAHPRHNGKVEPRLSNEKEIFDAIETWALDQRSCEINVVSGLFAHMPLKEQLKAILEASVVIGAHGAGLTHMVSATPDTILIEILGSLHRRPHFELIARWKDLEYHAINLPGSRASPAEVLGELSKVMTNLGC